MIDAADLAYMRAMVEETLWSSCVLQSYTRTSDDAGGYTEAWANVGTVDCRIDPMRNASAEDVIVARREGLKAIYQLTVPYNTVLDESYRVLYENEPYQILQLADVHSNRVCLRAVIGRIE